MTVVDHHLIQVPAALASPRQALLGLASLLNSVDQAAWASLARPTSSQLAHLVWAITSKLDEGLSQAGFAVPD